MRAPQSDSQLDLVEIAQMLKANAHEVSEDILQRWSRIGEAEPWQRLPPEVDLDHLPELIRRLAAAALGTEFDRDLCETVVAASAEHGSHRALEGLEEALVYREYHLLRRALWEKLTVEHGENATTYYAGMRLDALISLALAAGLHGWNRPTLEANGRWPEALTDLLDNWPLPRSS